MDEAQERGETKKITVTFDDQVTEYERVMISGKEQKEAHTNTTFMYGYTDFDKFINDFSNILITSAQFLHSEAEVDRDRVVDVLRDVCEKTFLAFLDGEFDQLLDDADHIE